VLKSTNGDLGLHTTLQRWNRYTDPNCQVTAATIPPMFVRQFRVRMPLTFGSICSTSAPLPLAESSRCDGVELRELQAEAAKRKVEVAMMKQSISGFAKRLKLMEMHHVAVRLITSDWLRAWDAADRVPSPLSQLDDLS
jgi:hypothetical protein